MGLHVVVGHRHPVFFLHGVGEGIRRDQVIALHSVISGSKLQQQNRCDRGLRHVEVGDLLRRSVFKDAEIGLPQAELAVLGGHQHINIHQGDVHSNGVVGHALDLGGRSSWRRGRRRVGLFLRDGVGADVVAGSSGFCGDFLFGLAVVLRVVLRRSLRLVLGKGWSNAGKQYQRNRQPQQRSGETVGTRPRTYHYSFG